MDPWTAALSDDPRCLVGVLRGLGVLGSVNPLLLF